MNLEPQKFFIGLMDFFSILLPGALITYVLMDDLGPLMLGRDKYPKLVGAQAWAAFLVLSYLFGHLIFLLGSWLDWLYDRLRRRTLNAQIALMARTGRLLSWPTRTLVGIVFKRESNLAVVCAGRIKRQALVPLQAKDAINTFQWSKAMLTTASPASMATVQRFEADSKFFRCLVIVLLVLVATWGARQMWLLAGVGVVLVPLAVWRYMEQRFKATNQAYWSVITLTAQAGKVVIDKPNIADTGPSHAGGIVFRVRGGQAEYLLVEAKDDATQWVLPKGHIEHGEHPRETAVREVLEGTGVWARITGEVGDSTYVVDGIVVTVRLFLMHAVGRGPRNDVDRRHVWLPLAAALTQASALETRELLQRAEMQRVRT